MLNCRKVAVTGGLSSGKTTVTRYLEELGAFTVSADEIVHQLLASPKIYQKIIALLGHDIAKDGYLDRKLIADKVFNDEKLLKKLEEILHPAVLSMMEEAYVLHHNSPLFVVEIPLLFEANYEGWFDATVAVSAPEEASIERFGSREEYFRRMKFQMPPKEKEARAHFTITNDSDLKSLKSHVVQLFHVLTQEEFTST